MADDNLPPIVVKKIKKVAGGHHGGAWKIAYADFVTAMMAFFLLMWLINATTEQTKRGLAQYFNPISIGDINGGNVGVMGGTDITSEDASLDAKNGTITVKPSAPTEAGHGEFGSVKDEKGEDPDAMPSDKSEANDKIAQEQKMFEQIAQDIKKAVQDNPEFKELMNNLLVEQTPEGLRIQLIDQEKQSMFPSGSSKMYEHTRKILEKVGEIINKTGNRIAISGHTDATPFANDRAYGNWELSSDRAHATRRTLEETGISAGRIQYVVGRESKEPLDKAKPEAPRNRRISITLLKEDAKSTPKKK